MSEISKARTPDTIAAEINLLKEHVRRTAVQAAIEIGQRLKEAKSLVPYGEWREWLEVNVDYSERTAQNMMALADEYANKETQAIADLPVTKAVMLLGVPSEDREAFMLENPVEDMSTRELKQAIEELKAEKARMQLTIDELMNAPAADTNSGLRERMEELDREKKELADTVTARDNQISGLTCERDKAQKSLDEMKQKQQEREFTVAQLEKDKRAQEKTIKRLQDELVKVSEPVVRTEDSPETLAKLERLRKEQADADVISRYKAGFELMKRGLDMQLEALEGMDAEVRSRYTAATVRALGITQDKLG